MLNASELPAFFVHVSEGLYLDSNNKFHAEPAPGLPVYDLGGGMLSLSSEVTGGVLSGTLAVLPVAEEASWIGKVRDLGFNEDGVKMVGDIASLASSVVTVVGWAQAALKIAEMLGIFKTGKSIDELAHDILNKLNVVQDMEGDAQQLATKVVLDTSGTTIMGARLGAAELMNLLRFKNDSERRAMRAEMLGKAEDCRDAVLAILSESRWELFNQSKQYHGTWGGNDPEPVVLTNPPWWGHLRGGITFVALDDDRVTWKPASLPPGYHPRFDYRAALPFAQQGVLSYLTIMTMAEPEFRSTARVRETLKQFAADIERLLRGMRATLVRTHWDPYWFRLLAPDDVVSVDPDGFFGPAPPEPLIRKPLFGWQVGALDLCAHTDAYFTQLGMDPDRHPAPSAPYKLGVLNFDWQPPDPVLEEVPTQLPPTEPPNLPYWKIRNAESIAAAANRQSERDYALLLQTSGYMQLAQLHATVLHLTKDPDRSETVTGFTRDQRHPRTSHEIQVFGDPGLTCARADVTATGTRTEYQCQTTAAIALQRPDRVDQIPVRFLLVALSAAAETDYATVLSETELSEGSAQATLGAAETFDWYIQTQGEDEAHLAPSHVQLEELGQHRMMALTPVDPDRATEATVWRDLAGYASSEDMPAGEMRNPSVQAVSFDYTLTLTTTDQDRDARIEVVSQPQTRNARHIYAAVEETLGSGNTLRTYFPIQANTELTFLSKTFFERERTCLARTTAVIDYISHHFSESVPRLPPGVPVTRAAFQAHVARVRAEAPEVVDRAIVAVSGHP